MISRNVALAALLPALLAACGDRSPTQVTPDTFLGCNDVRAHTIGTTVNGTLTGNSCIYLNDPTDFYQFTLAQQRTVTISLTSTQVDTWLFLFDRASSQLIGADDDSGEGNNALIVQSLAAGTYVIGATTFDGATGPYTLSTSQQ